MSTKPIAEDIDRTLSDLESLRRLIRRNGLTGFDESTPEGRLILGLQAELQKAANQKLPEIIVQEGVQMAIEAILFRRSLSTMLLKAKAPSPGTSKKAENQRAAFRIGVTAYKTFASALQDALYVMGVEGFGLKVAPAKEKTFEDLLADRAERLEARATQAAVTDSSTTASPDEPTTARPLPPRPVERDAPAVATSPRETGEGGDDSGVSRGDAGQSDVRDLPVDAGS